MNIYACNFSYIIIVSVLASQGKKEMTANTSLSPKAFDVGSFAISYASLVYVSWTTLLLKLRCMLQKRATQLGTMIKRPFTRTMSNQKHHLKSLKLQAKSDGFDACVVTVKMVSDTELLLISTQAGEISLLYQSTPPVESEALRMLALFFGPFMSGVIFLTAGREMNQP
jgi:hypothetical protein